MRKKETKKICRLCKLEVFENEDYVELKQFSFAKLVSRGFYHLSCFRNKFMLHNKLNVLTEKMNKIMDKVTG